MRKFAAYGTAAMLALSAVAGGISYAQDATAEAPSTEATAEAPSTELAAPPMAQKTWLGVAVSEDENGVTIARIAAGSPAETAQLEVGDVIVAVNDTPIASAADLRAVIEAAAAGDVVTLTVERDGEEVNAEVTLTAHEGRGGMRGIGMNADPLQIAQRALGVTLEAVDGGYEVVSVEDDAVFELEVGDVITAVNGEAIDTLDWHSLRTPDAEATTITLTVERGGEEVTLTGEVANSADDGVVVATDSPTATARRMATTTGSPAATARRTAIRPITGSPATRRPLTARLSNPRNA